jgi:hypothetical protein
MYKTHNIAVILKSEIIKLPTPYNLCNNLINVRYKFQDNSTGTDLKKSVETNIS